MLLTLHNLPMTIRYNDIKALITNKCGLTTVIMDHLLPEGDTKKVTIGVTDEDAAILVRKINGLYMEGRQLYIENVQKKRQSDQPYRASTTTAQLYQQNMPTVPDPPSNPAASVVLPVGYNQMGMYYMPMNQNALGFTEQQPYVPMASNTMSLPQNAPNNFGYGPLNTGNLNQPNVSDWGAQGMSMPNQMDECDERMTAHINNPKQDNYRKRKSNWDEPSLSKKRFEPSAWEEGPSMGLQADERALPKNQWYRENEFKNNFGGQEDMNSYSEMDNSQTFGRGNDYFNDPQNRHVERNNHGPRQNTFSGGIDNRYPENNERRQRDGRDNENSRDFRGRAKVGGPNHGKPRDFRGRDDFGGRDNENLRDFRGRDDFGGRDNENPPDFRGRDDFGGRDNENPPDFRGRDDFGRRDNENPRDFRGRDDFGGRDNGNPRDFRGPDNYGRDNENTSYFPDRSNSSGRNQGSSYDFGVRKGARDTFENRERGNIDKRDTDFIKRDNFGGPRGDQGPANRFAGGEVLRSQAPGSSRGPNNFGGMTRDAPNDFGRRRKLEDTSAPVSAKKTRWSGKPSGPREPEDRQKFDRRPAPNQKQDYANAYPQKKPQPNFYDRPSSLGNREKTDFRENRRPEPAGTSRFKEVKRNPVEKSPLLPLPKSHTNSKPLPVNKAPGQPTKPQGKGPPWELSPAAWKQHNEWRNQAILNIYKTTLKNISDKHKSLHGKGFFPLTYLKAAIGERIDNFSGDQYIVVPTVTTKKYRNMYPEKTDIAFYLALRKKVEAEGAVLPKRSVVVPPPPKVISNDADLYEKLPRFPERDKKAYNQLKKLNKKELATGEPSDLPPLLQKVISEEVDALQQFFVNVVVENETPQEKEIYDHIKQKCPQDFTKFMKVHVARRAMDITDNLVMKIEWYGPPPNKQRLNVFFKRLGVNSLRKSDKSAKSYIATIATFKEFDYLLKNKTVAMDETEFVFYPLYLTGENVKKRTRSKKQKSQVAPNTMPTPKDEQVDVKTEGKSDANAEKDVKTEAKPDANEEKDVKVKTDRNVTIQDDASDPDVIIVEDVKGNLPQVIEDDDNNYEDYETVDEIDESGEGDEESDKGDGNKEGDNNEVADDDEVGEDDGAPFVDVADLSEGDLEDY